MLTDDRLRGRRNAFDSRFARHLGLVAAALLTTAWVVAWIAYGSPLAFLRPADDAYYYLDTVRSVWHGMGVSTDGIHSTTGFHPLWFSVLLPFGAVLRAPDNAFVVVAQLLQILFFAVAVSGLARAALRLGSTRTAAAAAALSLLFPPWRNTATSGMEGGLALALLCWFLAQMVVVTYEPSRRNRLVGGTLAGLAVLARLDSVFVVGAVLIVVLVLGSPVRHSWRETTAATAMLLAPPALLVGAYLVVNVVFSGHALPITAALKSSFPHPDVSLTLVKSQKVYFLAVPLTWAGAVLYRKRPAATVVWGLAVGTTVFALYLAMFGRGVSWWHFVSEVPGAALAVGILLDRVAGALTRPRTRRWVVRGFTAVLGLVCVVPLVSSQFARYPNGERAANHGWRLESERAGAWANAALPSEALIGMKDSGAFGYYTRQPTMNLDGVISSWGFNDASCDGSAVTAMRQAGVRFVAHHAVPKDYRSFTIRLPCWRESADHSELVLDRAREVYRGRPYWRDGDPDRVFVIWRFRADAQGCTTREKGC